MIFKFKLIIALFILITFGIYITYPLTFHLAGYATGVGDELIIVWIQNWVIHTITTGSIFSLFDANLYYPFIHSLAYSDIFIPASLLSFIPLQSFKEPIVVINFTLISSLILLGFSVYLLCYYLTKDFFASLLAGTLVIFSPSVLGYSVHLQILGVEWVPLAILFFLKFLDKGKSKFLALSLLFFLLQVYNSFLPGYFILFSYAILLFFHWRADKEKTIKLITKKNIVLCLIPILLIIPITIPYFQVSKEFQYTRDIRDAIHFAIQPEDFLYPSGHTRFSDFLLSLPFNQHSQNGEFKPGYLGGVFTLLVVFTIGSVRKIPKQVRNDKRMLSFLTIAATGLILSLGPVLHLGRQTVHEPFPIPLPYALFYYIIPGFQGFRNSARWEMLFILAIVVVIAIALHAVLKKFSSKKKAMIYLILFIGVIAEFNFPMKFVAVPQKKDFPPVYAWLATTPKDTAIIELPIYNWNMWPQTQAELLREYYSTIHFRRTVNGYSGFSPPPWQVLVSDMLTKFPSRQTITQLHDMGVDYVIIHTDDYDRAHNDKLIVNKKRILSGKEILTQIKKYPQLKLIKQFDNTYVFALHFD